jgi:ribosome-binding factor A
MNAFSNPTWEPNTPKGREPIPTNNQTIPSLLFDELDDNLTDDDIADPTADNTSISDTDGTTDDSDAAVYKTVLAQQNQSFADVLAIPAKANPARNDPPLGKKAGSKVPQGIQPPSKSTRSNSSSSQGSKISTLANKFGENSAKKP